MENYILKPSKIPYYLFLFFAILFSIATIGTLYVLSIVPAEANLPKSYYLVTVPFILVAAFSIHRVLRISKLATFKLTDEGITNQKTNQTILWKNIADMYFFSTGKMINLANNLAFRTSEKENFTHITEGEYSREDLEKIEALHIEPRVKTVLENISNGKTETFHFLPLRNTIKQAFNLTESQFFKFDSNEILINKKELIYQNQKYLLQDLSKVNIANFNNYRLKTKSGIKILDINKLDLISCEVFVNVMNSLIEN